jgi:hypothetical protein
LASDNLKVLGTILTGSGWHCLRCQFDERKRKENAMMKTLEVMGEALRNQKHPFRKAEHHSKKSLKNRHERRKIKEYLHLGDWTSEEMEMA